MAVIAQVASQPNSATTSATTTVSPAAGPLTWSGAPPTMPARIPPTAAAMRPAATGAPEATAMPSESGTATRKTTSEAGTSKRASRRAQPVSERPRSRGEGRPPGGPDPAGEPEEEAGWAAGGACVWVTENSLGSTERAVCGGAARVGRREAPTPGRVTWIPVVVRGFSSPSQTGLVRRVWPLGLACPLWGRLGPTRDGAIVG